MRWGEHNTFEFVKLYLKHECLWNTDDPNYRQRPARGAAYTSLMREFKEATGVDSSPIEIKAKIKNIRSTYAQQLNKIIRHSRDPDSLYQPSLVWFKLMDDKFKNIVQKNVSTRSTDDPAYDASLGESERCWELGDAGSDHISLGEESSDQDLRVRIKKERRHDSYKPRKKKKPNYIEPEEATFATDNTEATITLEDEFEIYGKHVAAQLRRLDLNTALRLQMEINSMITGARLAEIQENNLED